jgi:putative ABC transport system permease protein
VAPGLFRTLRAPLVRGRDFDERDGLGAQPVVIINEAMARKHFPGEDPIGKRVCFDRVPTEDSCWRTIVGVAANVRRESLGLEEAPSFYAPVLQDTTLGTYLLVRTESDPLAILPAVRERVRALDPALPLFEVTTLDDVVSGSLARERFLLTLLGASAVIALALACVGIFGVVYHQTTRRVREIGIRVALGARSTSVMALVVRDGLKPVLFGIALGVAAAGLAVSVLSSLLFEVEPLDPPTFAAVVAIVLGAAVIACTVPARWASRLEAVDALRTD